MLSLFLYFSYYQRYVKFAFHHTPYPFSHPHSPLDLFYTAFSAVSLFRFSSSPFSSSSLLFINSPFSSLTHIPLPSSFVSSLLLTSPFAHFITHTSSIPCLVSSGSRLRTLNLFRSSYLTLFHPSLVHHLHLPRHANSLSHMETTFTHSPLSIFPFNFLAL